jgi:hypothetical protein
MGAQGTPGVQPGRTAAVEQRSYGHADQQQPRGEREQEGRQKVEPRAVGSISRLIHRVVFLAVVFGTVLVLLAWVVALFWGAIWAWHQLPLV